jgi:hypothetical protein
VVLTAKLNSFKTAMLAEVQLRRTAMERV